MCPEDIPKGSTEKAKFNVHKPEDLMKKTPEAILKAMTPEAGLKGMTPKVRLKKMTPKAILKAMAKPPEVVPECIRASQLSFNDSLTDIIYDTRASLTHSEHVSGNYDSTSSELAETKLNFTGVDQLPSDLLSPC